MKLLNYFKNEKVKAEIDLPTTTNIEAILWNGSNCKQSTRWLHVSWLKASALCI
jgi:hypothetical protein